MLNSWYFHHSHTRKMLSIFGTIFNDMRIVRYTQDGTPASVIHPIPIKFANEDVSISLNKQRANSKDYTNAYDGFKEHFPRMTFSLDSLSYDPSVKINSNEKIRVVDGDNIRFYNPPVPYIANITLNLIAKNQFDALQMFEQIIPYFNPSFQISVKDYPLVGCTYDMPISLLSTSMEDNYEEFEDNKRRVIYTLEFEVRMRFYGPSGNALEYDTQTLFINQFKEDNDLCDIDKKSNDIDEMSTKISKYRYIDVKRLRDMEYTLSQIENQNNNVITNICLEFNEVNNSITTRGPTGECLEFPILNIDNNIHDFDTDPNETIVVTDKNRYKL